MTHTFRNIPRPWPWYVIAARQLLEYGWTVLLLERYRQGHLSLGKLAREVGLSISETMDLVAQHGIQLPLDYDDYLQALEHTRKVW